MDFTRFSHRRNVTYTTELTKLVSVIPWSLNVGIYAKIDLQINWQTENATFRKALSSLNKLLELQTVAFKKSMSAI